LSKVVADGTLSDPATKIELAMDTIFR